MTSRTPSICDSCIHLEQARQYDPFRRPKCNAFPDGIPAEVWAGTYDHRDNHPLDNGVTYDLQPGREGILASWERWYDRLMRSDDD